MLLNACLQTIYKSANRSIDMHYGVLTIVFTYLDVHKRLERDIDPVVAHDHGVDLHT